MTNIESVSQMEFNEQKKYFTQHYSFFPDQNKEIKTTFAHVDILYINMPEVIKCGEFVEGFQKSLEDCGQISPVGLKRAENTPGRYDILFGKKRIYAMYQRGLRTIAAVIFEAKNTSYYDLIKIDEELVRVEVTALKRACLLGKRKEIYNKIFQEKAKIDETISSHKCFEPFSKFMSEKMNKSQRSIQQDLQIAENISKENRKAIEGTFLENHKNKLLEIARIENSEIQRAVVDKILNHEAQSIKDALLKIVPNLKIKNETIPHKEQMQKNIRELAFKVKNRDKEIAELKTEVQRLKEINEKLETQIKAFNKLNL